mmetsp:Transcript_62089/g.103091  ORF Transcript_62089/g.103091 Transcript_62089/m.103091 type:complete len:116 (+) Transcript_62089:175-522(+)
MFFSTDMMSIAAHRNQVQASTVCSFLSQVCQSPLLNPLQPAFLKPSGCIKDYKGVGKQAGNPARCCFQFVLCHRQYFLVGLFCAWFCTPALNMPKPMVTKKFLCPVLQPCLWEWL